MTAVSVEEKVIEKVRKVLYKNPTINNTFSNRIYLQHINSITEPKFPAISLHIRNSIRDFNARGYHGISLQIDIWVQKKNHTFEKVFDMADKIRNLIDRQDLTDTTVPVTVALITEAGAGPAMHDPDPDLLHYPLVYEVIAL